ncbi:MAG: pyridoxamine 5'-phosphate oxidase family protein [Rothia sp. (in: high G+C Gram-positive bacteria)]|nr:pyridoxamine 5'-phosphate oxidase family protein [Rothia sp. (in: high G+C Gram-positive bacteria)]
MVEKSVPSPLTDLDEETCWELLRAHSIGRLALRAGNNIDIITVKYTLHNGRIYFQSKAGENFSSIVVSRQVGFEIDEARSETVKSVIVYGQAEWHAHELPIDPAVLNEVRLTDSREMHWVEVTPESISGRELNIIETRR